MPVTEIFPLVTPKSTTILEVPCPLTIVAPDGTVQVYVTPGNEDTLYVTLVCEGVTFVNPTTVPITGPTQGDVPVGTTAKLITLELAVVGAAHDNEDTNVALMLSPATKFDPPKVREFET